MDIASLIGVFGGIGVFIVGIVLGGAGFGPYVDLPSVFITIGGTVFGVILAYPIDNIKDLPVLMGKSFREYKSDPNVVIEQIIELANKARKDGLLSLEESAGAIDDEFLKKGLMLIVDGTDPDLVRNLLETELDFIEDRHKTGAEMLEMVAALAPAFGMIGTLVGLIAMLQSLDDPSTLGPQMSVALVTTLYGSIVANMFFTPMANKLKIRSSNEMLERQIELEGLLSIQSGENPRIIEEKLNAFLPPSLRRNKDN